MLYRNKEFTVYSSNIHHEPIMCQVLVQELPLGLHRGRRNTETNLPSSHYRTMHMLHYHLLCSGTAIKIYFKEETTKLKFLLDNHVYSNPPV